MEFIDRKVVADSCALASPEDHEGRIFDSGLSTNVDARDAGYYLEEANGLGLPFSHTLVLFVGAASVRWGQGFLGRVTDELVLQHVRFDFFAADIRQHNAVNLYAWREWLT